LTAEPRTATLKITYKSSSPRLLGNETNQQGETNQTESTHAIGGKEEVGTLIATPFG